MADVRRSVHVDDPAPPKKALLPNLQRTATQLVCYSRLGRGAAVRQGAASDYRNQDGLFHQGASLS